MKNTLYRLIPALIFLVVAALALFKNSDFVEAGIWSCFALAILIPAFPNRKSTNPALRNYIATGLIILGILLLVLRLLGYLPVPVRPLP